MIAQIKKWFDEYGPKSIRELTEDTNAKVSEIHKNLKNRIENDNEYKALAMEKEKELTEIRRKMRSHQNLTISVIDHIEDLLWAKDLDGRYILANKSFREKLCYGISWEALEGKTDIELSKIFKKQFGELNHTFGEICANSDEIVLESEKSQEFLESGLINGKELKLVVSKSPIYNFKGILFGTCGTGRDVTQWYMDLEKAIKDCELCKNTVGKDILLKELNKLEFKVDGNGK